MSEEIKEEEQQSVEEQQPAVSKREAIVAEIFSWVKTIVAALVMAWFITTFLIVNAQVPSGSMENTVMTGDRLVANRLSYAFSDPKRFDIVVFKFPDDESKLYIKRIIGMPGDKVEIRNNQIYINGSTEPLDCSFIKEPMNTVDAVYEVPEGHYFMMGDNRNNSSDSRFWENTYVAKDKILGKAVLKYYPNVELLINK
jgi:signal peptidase I